MLVIFIYIIYYVISVGTLWGCYYFRQFTATDYKYNKPLQWKRRLTIIWTYLVAGLQGHICASSKILFYPIKSDFILGSAIFFLIVYLFALGWVETIKHPFKKK